MKKRLIILVIFIVVITFSVILFLNIKDYNKKVENEKRYEQIKKDVNNELERYMYVIAPSCSPENGTPIITHRDLVYNAGMDKEKLLDIDKKSYCKVYVNTECVEVGKWSWETYISCNDYTDEGYIDWEKELPSKE